MLQWLNLCFWLQERVAAGDSIPPEYILALHLYTIPCNLFQKCCKYMREGDMSGIKPFQVFVWYLWNAVNCLSASPQTVYRGLFDVNPWEILCNYKGQMTWPAFSSTTFSRAVGKQFIYKLFDCIFSIRIAESFGGD